MRCPEDTTLKRLRSLLMDVYSRLSTPWKPSTKLDPQSVFSLIDLGVLTTEGVILATEKLEVSFLLEENVVSDKIYCIDKHLYAVVSGLAADANFLLDMARQECQNYRLKFREPMPIEQLVIHICDVKQYYTQAGSSRPFGAAFLFAGYDKQNRHQLYSTDPAGNYAGWKATAIGTNNIAANSFLKQEYK